MDRCWAVVPVPPERLTYTRTLQLLREVIAEKGEDFVYEPFVDEDGFSMCRYVVQGQPSCLVGHVLHRAGISLTELAGVEDTTPNSSDGPWEDWGTAAALDLLAEVQEKQDQGVAWGEALALAIADTNGEQE